jgi:hypothetical protein
MLMKSTLGDHIELKKKFPVSISNTLTHTHTQAFAVIADDWK